MHMKNDEELLREFIRSSLTTSLNEVDSAQLQRMKDFLGKKSSELSGKLLSILTKFYKGEKLSGAETKDLGLATIKGIIQDPDTSRNDELKRSLDAIHKQKEKEKPSTAGTIGTDTTGTKPGVKSGVTVRDVMNAAEKLK